MNNLFRGYASTSLGVILMCAVAAEWLGFISVAPEHPHSDTALLVAFGIGAIMLFVPPGKIEEKLESGIDMVTNKIAKKP